MQIPRGDFGYNLTFTIQNSAGSAYNLTDYTINLKMWREGQPELLLNGSCTIIEAAEGTCYYEVQEGDFSRGGVYLAELELTKSGVREGSVNFEITVEESR